MNKEQLIQNKLVEKFPFLAQKIRIPRERRLFVDVSYDQFFPVFEHAKQEQGFSFLCTITGLDEGTQFGFIYHLARPDGVVLNLKTTVSKEKAAIKTVTSYFNDADIYEREIVDLLGVNVEGLKEGKRYPLPDNWPKGQFPLRKDWKAENLKAKSEGDNNNG